MIVCRIVSDLFHFTNRQTESSAPAKFEGERKVALLGSIEMIVCGLYHHWKRSNFQVDLTRVHINSVLGFFEGR